MTIFTYLIVCCVSLLLLGKSSIFLDVRHLTDTSNSVKNLGQVVRSHVSGGFAVHIPLQHTNVLLLKQISYVTQLLIGTLQFRENTLITDFCIFVLYTLYQKY